MTPRNNRLAQHEADLERACKLLRIDRRGRSAHELLRDPACLRVIQRGTAGDLAPLLARVFCADESTGLMHSPARRWK